MAIGTAEAPYIHSTYSNFTKRRTKHSIDVTTKSAKDSLIRLKEKLNQIRQPLRSAAENFLGGKTANELYKEIVNNDAFIEATRKLLNSSKAVDVLIQDDKIDLRSRGKNLVKEFQDSLQEITNQPLSKPTLSDISGYVLNQIQGALSSVTGKDMGSQQRSIIIKSLEGKGLDWDGVVGSLQQDLKRKISRPSTMERIIKNALKAGGMKTTKNTANATNRLFHYLKSGMTMELKNSTKSYNLEELNNYLNSLKKYFESNKAFKEDYSNPRHASGDLLESGNLNLFNYSLKEQGKSDLTFTLIGPQLEVNARKMLNQINNQFYTFKSPNRQSYSDWYITKGNNSVRVQVKNQAGIIENYIKYNSNINSQISLSGRDQSLKELMETFSSTGEMNSLSFDAIRFSYNLLNEVWFSQKGDYASKETHNIDYSIINRDLTAAYLNYLGVVLDNNLEVQTDVSNIFFFVNGEGLIPTYRIIDDLIRSFTTMEQQLSALQVRVNLDKIQYEYDDKESFHDAKMTALDGKKLKGDYYTDSALLSIGTSQGKKMYDSIEAGVNLKINIDQMLRSTYNFSKKY